MDRTVREGLDRMGYPGQPTHPVCHGVGARAHEPPYPHQAGGGTFAEGMVLAVEPGVYWAGGGGLRLEDNFLLTADGPQKLSPFPDGIVRC
jgi:Xaa-Pro aminopeptidase